MIQTHKTLLYVNFFFNFLTVEGVLILFCLEKLGRGAYAGALIRENTVVMCSKDANVARMFIFRSSLIWVCSVCSNLSIPILTNVLAFN